MPADAFQKITHDVFKKCGNSILRNADNYICSEMQAVLVSEMLLTGISGNAASFELSEMLPVICFSICGQLEFPKCWQSYLSQTLAFTFFRNADKYVYQNAGKYNYI